MSRSTPARFAPIEGLESRCLFNATITDFIGPVKTDSTLDYDVYSSGTLVATQVEEPLGASSFQGTSCTRIKSTFTAIPGGETSEQDQYVGPTSSGEVVYGLVETATVSGHTSNITTTYVPNNIEVPSSLAPARYYKYVYTATLKTTITPPGTSSSMPEDFTVHIKLESSTLVTVHDANGTAHSCYKFIIKTTTSSGTKITEWWADPSEGLVKSITTGGGEILMTGYHS